MGRKTSVRDRTSIKQETLLGVFHNEGTKRVNKGIVNKNLKISVILSKIRDKRYIHPFISVTQSRRLNSYLLF